MNYRRTFLALVATLAFAGCASSKPSRFYSLSATAAAGAVTNVAVLIDPVTIPASVDRPQFVVQVAANRVEVDEFNRWDAPLGDSVARVIASDLSTELGTPQVAIAPLANFKPAYTVAIDIQRFDSIKDQAAVLDAVWTVREITTGNTRSGRTLARAPLQGQDFDAIAAAHSRALTRMSSDIAAAIRLEATRSVRVNAD
jgi:uncharacterized protein